MNDYSLDLPVPTMLYLDHERERLIDEEGWVLDYSYGFTVKETPKPFSYPTTPHEYDGYPYENWGGEAW